jgi:hypothetical protein
MCSFVFRLGVLNRQGFSSVTNRPSPSLADKCDAVSQK